MENNREPNNPWEMQRVNINRPGNLMQDIKKPISQVSPVYRNDAPIQPPQIKEYDIKKQSHTKLYIFLTFTVLLLVIVGYTAFYFYQKANKATEVAQNEPLDQLNLAIAEVGKLVILPINDTPTLSVVVDANQAKNDPAFSLFKFFENTEAGDMWLSYSKTGKNILYRPTTKKIVNMMTFPPDLLNNISSTTTATTTATTTKTR
jgi:heme/copper-type cytochrome/quinol oxidase subunit 2